jgi:predicted nucleotidyltransferase
MPATGKSPADASRRSRARRRAAHGAQAIGKGSRAASYPAEWRLSLANDYNPRMKSVNEQVLHALSGFPEIRLVLLFGSRASGRPRPDSDVDLGMLTDTPLSAERRASIIEAVARATGCPVDLVDLHDAPEPVLGEALKGIRLLGDATDHARLLTRHVLNAADFLPLRERILAERRAAWTG